MGSVFRKKEKVEGTADMDEIVPNLVLGSYQASNCPKQLKAAGVTHILRVVPHEEPPYPDDFTYKEVKIADQGSTCIGYFFDESIKFMDDAIQNGGTVFVHCLAGVSRSATFVCAYLMQKNQWGFEKTLEFVKEKRKCVNPNSGFRTHLALFEKYKYAEGLNWQKIHTDIFTGVQPGDRVEVFFKMSGWMPGILEKKVNNLFYEVKLDGMERVDTVNCGQFRKPIDLSES